MENEKIQKRTLRFAIKVTKFVFKLSRNYAMRILLDQLLRSGTSVGANMEEADSAVSKKDFINKVSISKKEARETRYWLIILKEAELLDNEDNKRELESLLGEIGELIKIIGAIHSKAKANKDYN